MGGRCARPGAVQHLVARTRHDGCRSGVGRLFVIWLTILASAQSQGSQTLLGDGLVLIEEIRLILRAMFEVAVKKGLLAE